MFESSGLFWAAELEKKNKAVKKKAVPPARTWEKPDYLPYLEDAKVYKMPLMDLHEMEIQQAKKDIFIWDIECYSNYFLVGFKSVQTGKVIYFEKTPTSDYDVDLLQWILRSFTLVGFNSNKYDLPLVSIALTGVSTIQLKEASNALIDRNTRYVDVLRSHRAKLFKADSIDISELCPMHLSLKLYAGRLHCKRMQDLPFPHHIALSHEQMLIVRYYWVNDLENTELLYKNLKERIDLRVSMSDEYGVDLRSKSDAQIAETAISHELERLTRRKPVTPTIPPGTSYRYNWPEFIRFKTPALKEIERTVRNARFVVAENGSISMPPELAKLSVHIGLSTYRMGIGGLHSTEANTTHIANADWLLRDADVTAFYPNIILNLGIFPTHIKEGFPRVYGSVVERREKAKREKNKIVDAVLKIVINGLFGKLGSVHSAFYSPQLLIQVTLTGQLSLLMLIESLELAGIQVVSGNTDGIVSRIPAHLEERYKEVCAEWMRQTRFKLEFAEYAALCSRDVNNYLAIKTNGEIKTKGIFAKSDLRKNPNVQICTTAVCDYLVKGIPIEQTIKECEDIREFLTVRTVKGGAVWKSDENDNGTYLGKAIRWYYSAANPNASIVYADSGNAVPRSIGVTPPMQLPNEFPDDIDYDWYVNEAKSLLTQLGFNS